MKTSGVTFSTGWLDLATASGATAAIPPGVIAPFAGSAAPTGWLICDGSAISRNTYSVLFTAIGTTYGAGDGSTTFNLPDLRGRTPAGYAPSGGHSDVSALGNNEGVGLTSRRPRHNHNASTSSNVGGTNTGGANAVAQVGTSGTSAAGIYSTAVGPQTGAEPNNSQAYLVVNFVIKT